MAFNVAKQLLTIFTLCRIVSAKLEGKIVGGEFADIEEFPHSAFLSIECPTEEGETTWLCGSSIINQKLLLTAAHCFEECLRKADAVVNVGSANRHAGHSALVSDYKMHENYNPDKIENDITLVLLKKNLPLGRKVQRVVLMKKPPYNEVAMVAGWGLINEITPRGSDWLKYLKQKVVSRNSCMQTLDAQIPRGTICATLMSDNSQYAASGDSGSALIVRRLIQVGLVSFKNPRRSRSLVVYTDIGYFYPWIVRTARNLYCGFKF